MSASFCERVEKRTDPQISSAVSTTNSIAPGPESATLLGSRRYERPPSEHFEMQRKYAST
jgi:hypothetical protein